MNADQSLDLYASQRAALTAVQLPPSTTLCTWDETPATVEVVGGCRWLYSAIHLRWDLNRIANDVSNTCGEVSWSTGS
jgi:hypothetical protein